jgi:hypothetical protein
LFTPSSLQSIQRIPIGFDKTLPLRAQKRSTCGASRNLLGLQAAKILAANSGFPVHKEGKLLK